MVKNLQKAGLFVGLKIYRGLISTEDVEDWQTTSTEAKDSDTHPLVEALTAINTALEKKLLTDQDWIDLDKQRKQQGKSPLKRDGRTIPSAYQITLVPQLTEIVTKSGRIFFQ